MELSSFSKEDQDRIVNIINNEPKEVSVLYRRIFNYDSLSIENIKEGIPSYGDIKDFKEKFGYYDTKKIIKIKNNFEILNIDTYYKNKI